LALNNNHSLTESLKGTSTSVECGGSNTQLAWCTERECVPHER